LLALIAMTWPYVSFDLIECRFQAEKSNTSPSSYPHIRYPPRCGFQSEFAVLPLFITPHGALLLQSFSLKTQAFNCFPGAKQVRILEIIGVPRVFLVRPVSLAYQMLYTSSAISLAAFTFCKRQTCSLV